MHAFFRTFVAWVLVDTASAFQCPNNSRMASSPSILQPHLSRPNRHHTILHQSPQDDVPSDDDEEYEMVEFFVSPEQISLLRKEALKRESRKKLPKLFLPAEETLEATSETIEAISNLFDASELIEVRGVSRDAKKLVFDTAQGLASTVEDEMEKPVVVVDIKGFAVKLYCPWDDEQGGGGNAGKRIQLRTSYRPGQWARKAKPIRDNRGQIIRDEDGKSVKEIPEY